MSEYFGVYVAVRSFNVKVEKFSVTVFNRTYALTETLLAIQNPSRYTFEVIFIMQKLFFNEALFGMETFDLKGDPMWMRPQSNATTTIQIYAGSLKVSELTESEEKDWSTLIHVGVVIPLVGRSMVRLQEELIPEVSGLEAGFPHSCAKEWQSVTWTS